jgi:tRNA(fMet)-specific endonuclease VapC
MPDKILIDTDILIDFTKGHGRELENLLGEQETGKTQLFISPINVAEFLNDTQLTGARLNQALEFLEWFNVTEITKTTGIKVGEILRERKINFIGDALVAAVCLENNLALVSRNKKHFGKIRGLKFLTNYAGK